MERSDQHDAPSGPSALRKGLRWAAIGLAGLLLAGVAASALLHTVLDAAYFEQRINRRLASETDSLYRIEIGAVDWSLLQRSFEARAVSLHPISGPRSDSASAESTGVRYAAEVPMLRLSGIHLWPILWRRALVLNRLGVQSPQVRLLRRGADSIGGDSTASQKRSAYSVHGALARKLPPIEAQSVQIDEGTLSIARAGTSRLDSLWDLSVRMHDVSVDSTAARDTSRVLFSRAVDAEAAGYQHRSANRLYAFTTGPVRASAADSTLSIDSLQLAPTAPDEAFFRQIGHRANRYETAARSLALTGVDFRRFVEQRAIHAQTARLDSLIISVYRNNHWPRAPYDPPPPMPHETFQSISRPVRIDTIRVTNGDISYSKLAEDAARPGTISFENTAATITNVTNNPQGMTRSTPAVVNATTDVAGAGRLRTTIRLPLLDPGLTLSYRGQLGPMDVRAFNTAFVSLAGVRVERGRVDSLRFAAQVENGVASGSVRGVYRNLEVELLDPKSGARGLGKRIKTFILDDFVIKSSNTAEDRPLRTGTIDFTHTEGDPFFKFLWHSVRDGLFSLVGM